MKWDKTYPDFEKWRRESVKNQKQVCFAMENFYIIGSKGKRVQFFTYDEAIKLEKKIMIPNGWRLPTAEEWRGAIAERSGFNFFIDRLGLSEYGFIPKSNMSSYRRNPDNSDLYTNNLYVAGYYWSSDCFDKREAISLTIIDLETYTDISDRRNGFLIRCVTAD